MLNKIILLAIVLSMSGCSSSTQRIDPIPFDISTNRGRYYDNNLISLHFGGGFNDNRVECYINGEFIYLKTLTSDLSTAFADELEIKKTDEPSIDIKIIVDGKSWESNLNINNGHFFNISLRRESIEILQAKNQFYYD